MLSPAPRHSLAEGEASVRRYLRRAAAVLPHLDPEAARVEYLDAGIMNYVYRVTSGGRVLYLKQALPRVKEHDRLGDDLRGVSPARIQAECRALELLAGALPAGWRGAVPRVAWYDAESNVLWTDEIAPGARSLQSLLAEGRFEPGPAARLGRLLAAVHRVAGVPPLWPDEREDRANWERFLLMRTLGVLERAELPAAAAAAVHDAYREASEHARPGMLSHLDAAPKNVLVEDGGGVALLDFELGAAISDPAYDPGFLVGHYLLMGENRPAMRAAARAAAAALMAAYAPADPDAWGRRVIRYAGLVLLYRLCGSSPAPYLDPARYGAIRAEGIRLLTEPAGSE